MSRMVFILGNPGTGKTSSLRNLKKNEVGYISVSGKELGFKSDIQPVVVKNLASLIEVVKKSSKPIVVIDDLNFVFNHEVHAAKDNSDQWNVFRKIKDDFYELVEAIISKPTKQNFYCMAHIEPNEQNLVWMKTAGNAIRKDITPEGLTNIVLESMYSELDGGFVFRVKSDGRGVKSPGFGGDTMFDQEYVPNDLKDINNKINEYYKETK